MTSTALKMFIYYCWMILVNYNDPTVLLHWNIGEEGKSSPFIAPKFRLVNQWIQWICFPPCFVDWSQFIKIRIVLSLGRLHRDCLWHRCGGRVKLNRADWFRCQSIWCFKHFSYFNQNLWKTTCERFLTLASGDNKNPHGGLLKWGYLQFGFFHETISPNWATPSWGNQMIHYYSC